MLAANDYCQDGAGNKYHIEEDLGMSKGLPAVQMWRVRRLSDGMVRELSDDLVQRCVKIRKPKARKTR